MAFKCSGCGSLLWVGGRVGFAVAFGQEGPAECIVCDMRGYPRKGNHALAEGIDLNSIPGVRFVGGDYGT